MDTYHGPRSMRQRSTGCVSNETSIYSSDTHLLSIFFTVDGCRVSHESLDLPLLATERPPPLRGLTEFRRLQIASASIYLVDRVRLTAIDFRRLFEIFLPVFNDFRGCTYITSASISKQPSQIGRCTYSPSGAI